MTSTPYFALAQHPETGEWALYEWLQTDPGWEQVTEYYPTRIEAMEAMKCVLDTLINTGVESAALDRLIAIERGHTAGDEAHVQTIRALGYDDYPDRPSTHGSAHDSPQR